MKMNYLSGGKKSILGTRLSSRYLSSDAFTSSAGKTSGRSISRLGSLFGRGTSKKFSGTGQRVGLFELKDVVVKFICGFACLVVIGYTLPFTRYAVHAFFVQHMSGVVYPLETSSAMSSTLSEHEYYVSPVFGKTDRFVFKESDSAYPEGARVYMSGKDVLLGTLVYASSSRPYVVLLSDVGQKHNLFLEDATKDIFETETLGTTSSSTPISSPEEEGAFSTAVFEGFGYGQMRAQVPPQEEIAIDTILYARTERGLAPAARVSYVEKDTGSTFTNIYAQLLVAPFQIYKVRIGDI